MTFIPPVTVRPLAVGAAYCMEFECIAPEDWSADVVINHLRSDYGIGDIKLRYLGTFEGCRKWHVRRG